MKLDVIPFVAIFGGSLLLYHLTAALSLAYSRRRFKAAHGCREPKRWDSGFYGIKEFRRIMAWARKKAHVEYVCGRFDTIGKKTMMASFLGADALQTIEPDNIKAMLATQFKDFELGKVRYNAFHAMLGEGIFTLDGKGWEYSRALLRPQFNREQVADVDMLEIHVNRLLELMAQTPPDTAVDLQPWIFGLTLDTATEFLFGESVECLLHGEENREGFAYAYNNALKWVVWRLRFQLLAKWWPPKEMKEVNTTIHRYVDAYVQSALKREKRKQGYVFLDAVAADTRDPIVLRSQMLNILLAGRDTTAGLIGWTFFLLARHPAVYRKLRVELEKAFGTGTPGVWRQPRFEELKDVVYLRHVLNEVLRLYPSVPINSREAVRDTTLPRGGGPDEKSPVFIPKGMRVQYAVYALHRRKDLYGADAEEFRPERWSEGRLGRNWEYLPFNGGPRICLGQQYALTEAGFTVTRILQHYENILPGDDTPGAPMEATLTIAPQRCLVKLVPVAV